MVKFIVGENGPATYDCKNKIYGKPYSEQLIPYCTLNFQEVEMTLAYFNIIQYKFMQKAAKEQEHA